jgi:hypothetical protein
MAASLSTGTVKKNYYGVSYGKLSTNVKEIPNEYEEITEADLKAKTQEVIQVDLRKKYINKSKGDFPYKVFFDSLTGTILAQEKKENDNGAQLTLTVQDTDGDVSLIQVNFYSKYNENLLNRLLNTPTDKQFTFFPYAIPNEINIDGVKKKFYTQGVSLKADGAKIEPKWLDQAKDPKSLLPNTEQVKVKGKDTTSRDNRLNWLYSEFTKHFTGGIPQKTENKSIPIATTAQAFEFADVNAPKIEIHDLPF